MDVQDTVEALTQLGYKLRMVRPADAREALLDADGVEVRIGPADGVDEGASTVVFADELVRVGGGDWGDGRVPGMQYRDLVPNRRKEAVIASHIRIPTPVRCPTTSPSRHWLPDHPCAARLGRGGVRGPGRTVLDARGRHRAPTAAHPTGCSPAKVAVRSSSMAPAEHPTLVDLVRPWSCGGQRFSWVAAGRRRGGWEERRSGVEAATSGVGGVRTLRATSANASVAGSPRHAQPLLRARGDATLTVDDTVLQLGVGELGRRAERLGVDARCRRTRHHRSARRGAPRHGG